MTRRSASGGAFDTQEVDTTGSSASNWATAYHEAGHCVVGLVAGESPKVASIVAGGDNEGATMFDDDTVGVLLVDDPPREAAQWHIVRCFAGPSAEHRYTGEGVSSGACDDYARAVELLMRLTADPDRLSAVLLTRTEAVLDEHWSAVEQVAAALVQHLSLDGEAIRQAAQVKGSQGQ